MYLEISSNKHFPDEIQAKAAGFAEGFLTRNMIYHYFQGMILKTRLLVKKNGIFINV